MPVRGFHGQGLGIVSFLAMLSAAIAPGAALLTYIFLRDKYGTMTIGILAKPFVIGVLLVFPTMVIQRGFMLGPLQHDLLFAFVYSAGIEEFVKWFALYFVVYKHERFSRAYDGIMYAAAISLGFATLENLLYAWSYQSSFTALLLRGLLPVSAHALFAIPMGYYLGRATFAQGTSRKRLVLMSLAIPVLWHGMFDYIIVLSGTYWFLLLFPFMIGLWLRGLRKLSNVQSYDGTNRRIGS